MMDSTAEKKLDCDEDCECKDCEERCVDDNEKIHVSVKPRRFSLPAASSKKAKMEIKNGNSYPIYFKASTSNMNAFRPVPDNGRITPKGKASVDVQFYNSAVPMRRHEEVIVFTSVKPFEQYALYKETVCPFCMEPFNISKLHNLKSHGHDEYCISDQGHRSYQNTDTKITYAAKDYEEYNKKHMAPTQKMKRDYEKSVKEKDYEDFDETYTTTKRIRDREYDQKPTGLHREGKDIAKIQDGLSKGVRHAPKHFVTSEQKMANSDEKLYYKRDYSPERAKQRAENHELKEMSIHASTHRPLDSTCSCKECVEIAIEKDRKKKQGVKQYMYEKRIKSDESVSERKLYGAENDFTHGVDDTKNGRKVKGKEAHILTRVLSAESGKDALSQSNMLDLSRKEEFVRKTKIISEEDYNRKREKLKKKLQKQYGEESESTLAAELLKESDVKITEMGGKSMLTVLDEKCSTLLKLSWTNLFLLVLLIFVACGCLFCCWKKSGDTAESDGIPCIFDVLNIFG